MMTKLTVDVWNELVKVHFRRAYRSQWIEGQTDAEMDYACERLIEENWSREKATWAVREVCRKYRKLEQPLAMMCQVADGMRNRDGEVIGGWNQSRECVQLCQDNRDERARQECREQIAEGVRDRRECGTRAVLCKGCEKGA